MKLKANAKINLFLDILNKRKDGYHNIKTVFQEISLPDKIFINEIKTGTPLKRDSVSIVCDNPFIPTDKTNLVYKAADSIKKYSGIKKGVLIEIKKRIPVGAGLGGGSSDAAAVLKGLNKLWELNLTKNQLVKMAKKIGADVPFFIEGGRCLGEGIGAQLTPLKIRKTKWYVLVKPSFEISTKFAYSLLTPLEMSHRDTVSLTELTKSNKISKITPINIGVTLNESEGSHQPSPKRFFANAQNDNICFNKLEDIIIPRYPEIKKIKEKLVDCGAEFSLMSGSGSCVFGFVKNKSIGEKIKNKMKKDGYAVWLVHSIKAENRKTEIRKMENGDLGKSKP